MDGDCAVCGNSGPVGDDLTNGPRSPADERGQIKWSRQLTEFNLVRWHVVYVAYVLYCPATRRRDPFVGGSDLAGGNAGHAKPEAQAQAQAVSEA